MDITVPTTASTTVRLVVTAQSLLHCRAPPAVATLRDTALSVLRATGCGTVASRLRHHSQYPDQAVALVTAPPTARA